MITKSNHRLNRLRFRDLELLLALAETGSLRRAAVVLGVSQPALSKSLREIEDAFQVPLYVRHRSGLRPTPAGERLQAAAEVMINELAFTRSAVQATRVEPIRLGVTPLAARLLPRVLHALPRPFATISEATVPDLLRLWSTASSTRSSPIIRMVPRAKRSHTNGCFASGWS